MQQLALATPAILIELIDGRLTTTSLDVAKHFKKRHDTVLRSIRQLNCSPNFHARNFAEMIIEVEAGKGATRNSPAFRLTRDGFIFLGMGFTGDEAAQMKEAYIEGFNRMEEALRGAPVQSPELPPLLMQRWLTTFDSAGQQHTRLLSIDDIVTTIPQLVKNLPGMNPCVLPTPQLFALAMQAMGLLQERKVDFTNFAL